MLLHEPVSADPIHLVETMMAKCLCYSSLHHRRKQEVKIQVDETSLHYYLHVMKLSSLVELLCYFLLLFLFVVLFTITYPFGASVSEPPPPPPPPPFTC